MNLLQKQELEAKKLSTGTTTLGLICKDCTILAADMQATMGNIASGKELDKIFKINDKVGVTVAGTLGDALTVVRFIRSKAKLYEIERETPMNPKATMTFLANILSANRYFPYFSAFILGGYNGKPELYTTDVIGGFTKEVDYASDGSGFQLVYGLLEEQYRKELSEEDAVRLAVKAIAIAKKRDVFTGGKSIKVVVIDKAGYREIPEAKIKKLIDELKKDE